jgi:hypothetical protein
MMDNSVFALLGSMRATQETESNRSPKCVIRAGLNKGAGMKAGYPSLGL